MFKSKRNSINTEKLYYEEAERLRKRVSLEAQFGDVPVSFDISPEWHSLRELCVGRIEFRLFCEGTEKINGQRRKIKCAQNFWKKGATLNGHYHSDSDEYLYLVHGLLEVSTINEKDQVKTRLYDSTSDQPVVIKKGIKHYIRAIEDVSFVAKFVIC